MNNQYYEELRFLSEGRWADEVVLPKRPWDERKPTGELVKELFDLGPFLPEGKPLPVPRDEAQAYLTAKLKDARLTVAQIQAEALARGQLHDESIREIDYQISRAALSMDQFTGIGISHYTGIEIRRAHLERQLANFRRDRRTAFLRTWEDIAKLRKEFREAVIEYKSLLSRLGLL